MPEDQLNELADTLIEVVYKRQPSEFRRKDIEEEFTDITPSMAITLRKLGSILFIIGKRKEREYYHNALYKSS